MTPCRTLAAAVAAACALAPPAGPALAQTATAAARADVDVRTRMAMHVNTVVFDRLAQLLEPQEILGLIIVAQQAAIAINCEGFDVDPGRHAAAVTRLTGKLSAMTEAGQNNLPQVIAMSGYALAMGGELAAAGYDIAAFCARGETMRAEFAENPDSAWLLVWTDR